MIQIKLKGAKAITVLGQKGGVAGLELNVGAATKAGAARLGEMEGARAGIGKAALARGGELEGARAGIGKAALARGGELEGARLVSGTREAGVHHLGIPKAKVAAIGIVTPKGVGMAHGAAVAKASGAGTLWSGTGMSLGIGLGLGGYGPLLLIGIVGLTATGIYLWQRERAKEQELDELDGLDDFDDFEDLDDVDVVEAVT